MHRTPWRCTQRYGKEGHISDPSQGKRRFNPCWINHAIPHLSGYLTPREAPSLVSEDQFADLGAIEDQLDPESRFAFQHQARLEAKKTFIHLDTSKRVQRALLRSAKPIPQTYSVGDVVCFRRDNQPGKTTWSPASRVIGHEGNENQNVWVLCENIPVLVSAQNIRPARDAEALAHAILHGHSIIPEAIVRGQQEFEDATAVPAKDRSCRAYT